MHCKSTYRLATTVIALLIAAPSAVYAQSVMTYGAIHHFERAEGANPTSLLLGADGDLYGVCQTGGASYNVDPTNPAGYGDVIKSDTAGNVTVLHSFVAGDFIGAPLVQAPDGNLYGLLSSVGSAPGAVYRVTTGGTYSLLHTFDTAGIYSPISLIVGTDGNLYGTATQGGTSSVGGVFKLTLTGTYTVITDSVGPTTIMQAIDGDFYCTTPGDFGKSSPTNFGTIYKVTPFGVVTTLHAFSGTDGYFLAAPLAQLSNGTFYGTTVTNLAITGYGTIFSMTAAGAVTTLHTFNGKDGSSPTKMIVGSDGNLYGVTSAGGVLYSGTHYVNGTVFRLTPSGTFTSLVSLDGLNGQVPGDLVEAADGSFYGPAYGGGAAYSQSVSGRGLGTLFKVEAPVHTFAGGLQFISLPWDYQDPLPAYAYLSDPPSIIFGNPAAKIAVWNPTTLAYSITPKSPANTFRQGYGAWIRFSGPISLRIVGSDISSGGSVPVTLAAGWNMIGDPSTSATPIANITVDSGAGAVTFSQAVTDGVISPTLYSYTIGGGYVSHTSADSLQPYSGYWIFANSACTLHIPAP